MQPRVTRHLVVGVSVALATAGMSAPAMAQEGSDEGGITTIAAGLSNPRGFDWAPDGSLYLAQAGWGGDNHVALMDGFTVDNGLTSSVGMVTDGCVTPAATGVPSVYWHEAGWIWGAMDVAFLGDQAYVLLSGSGPAWYSPANRSGVYRLEGDGSLTLVGDVSTWSRANLPTEIPPDFTPDGSLFDLEAANDSLLLTEAVGGQLVRVTPDGTTTTVVDMSVGHLVPTGIALDAEGNAFVGHLTAAPYVDGASKVVKVAPDGTVADHWTGLTVVTDVALGPDGVLYATEMATGNSGEDYGLPAGSGRIVRQTGPDSSEAVVTDLAYPVQIGFDADGRLLVSGPAFGPDAGAGQGWLAAVDISNGPVSFAGFEPDTPTCA